MKNQLMEIILIDGKRGWVSSSALRKNAMKIKYLILLINLLNAQDSLYWFDMSTVRDPVPIAPKILDAIYGKSQLNDLDSLKNIRATTRNGFRIQLYESSSSEKVNNLIKKYKKKMIDSLYVIFEAPFIKFTMEILVESLKRKNKEQLRQKGLKHMDRTK